MSELVAFLEARLAEDEAVVDGWYQAEELGHPMDDERARWAERVLREVTAKRAILDGLRDAEAVVARIGTNLTGPGDLGEWMNYHAWQGAAEAVASVWSDHPDFQEQWR